jgi:hypothetical protein
MNRGARRPFNPEIEMTKNKIKMLKSVEAVREFLAQMVEHDANISTGDHNDQYLNTLIGVAAKNAKDEIDAFTASL